MKEDSLGKKILALAVPSLGSLLAEPLMVLGDSAMIGHVGTEELAGLTLASSINVFLVGMCIFLVYTTTAVAARKLGEGDQKGVIKAGIDGMWLATIVGALLTLFVYVSAPVLMEFFNANDGVYAQGVAYLRSSCWSLFPMAWVLAGTGALRGQLDTRTPFLISMSGAVFNVGVNAILIFGARLAVVGAGYGTSIAAMAMGIAFVFQVAAGARRAKIELRPRFADIFLALNAGVPLMIRTFTMHIVIMGVTWVAASQGEVAVAGRQIANTTWSLTANILDALAIAGQALIGYELGRGDKSKVRVLVRQLTVWGIGAGLAIGVVTAVLAPLWPHVFSSDPEVLQAAMYALIVSAIFQPLGGLVFMYDGVLIGANDSWYLAKAGVINLMLYAPALWAVWMYAPQGAWGLAWLWACYCGVFFAARWLTLGLRIRRDTWMKL